MSTSSARTVNVTNSGASVTIGEAKKRLSPDALARAIMARAEAAGQSVTEWLADEEHAAECVSRNTADCGCQNSTVSETPQLFSGESKK